jgi:hypothetical protein
MNDAQRKINAILSDLPMMLIRLQTKFFAGFAYYDHWCQRKWMKLLFMI